MGFKTDLNGFEKTEAGGQKNNKISPTELD